MGEIVRARLRWALAGRNRAKLEQTRAHLETIEPAAAHLDLIEADIGDPNSMGRVAESAKVVISTVGPYIRYGEPLVAACAEAGTDYVDLTGEPEFVDRMWLKYHARATETGARLVHSCGFDSIPHDLGVQYTVDRLPEGVPITVEVGAPLQADDDTARTDEALRESMNKLLYEAQQQYPHPAGEYWVPHRLGGGAPTLAEAAEMDAVEAAARAAGRTPRQSG